MRWLALGAVAILAAALGSMRAATAAVPPSPPTAAPQTRSQKIAELTADLGYGADIRHVDAAIASLTANVAAADPAWNPTHRHWAAVRGMVKTALRDDAERMFGETEVHIREGAEFALNEGAAGEDLDACLAFFRSGPGRHFQELQDALTDLGIEINLVKDADTTGLLVENLDARKQLLELWLPIVFIRTAFQGQASERTVDAAYEKFSRLRGREVDALATRYAGELPQFEAFIHSVSFIHIIDAERLGAEPSAAPNLAAFFATEAARHGAEWHAAYMAP